MPHQDPTGHLAPAPALHLANPLDGAPPVDDAERRRVTDAAFARWHDDATADPQVGRRALEDVVMVNLGVARGLAAAYRDKGIPREDLEQVACTALVAAARRFRPGEGRDFLSFAVPTIRGELKRHFRDCGWTVRPPRRVQEIHLRVLAARDALAKRLERVPTAAEVAAELGECEQHVVEALRLDGCFAPSSLDQPLPGGGACLGDLLPEGEERSQDAAEARVILGPAVRRLGDRDRYVIRLRFFEGLTQQEIGDQLGVTQTQVSRILTRITGELRACLASEQDAMAS
jgi:RNA polymerase sigma-B factor